MKCRDADATLAALLPVVPVLPELCVELRLSSASTGTITTICCRRRQRSRPAILWANLHLLFWLSLFPFATAVDGREPRSPPRRPRCTAWCCCCAAIAYYVLQRSILAGARRRSGLASRRLGSDWKGKLSPVLYVCAIAARFRQPVAGLRPLRAGRADLAHPRSADRTDLRQSPVGGLTRECPGGITNRMPTPHWHGVFPAVTTQFREDQSLDLGATARHWEP